MLRFEEFTPDNWRVDIRVKEEQQSFVASRVTALARAWAFRNRNARAYLICRDDDPVGMVLWHDWAEEAMYVLSEFFIDGRYQGQGLGHQAMCRALDMLAAEGRFRAVTLCYTAGNETAHRFYRRLGFEDVDDGDEEEPCMALSLDQWRAARGNGRAV